MAGLLAGCGPDGPATREVRVDGGSEDVVVIAPVTIRVRPGDLVRLVNANGGPTDPGQAATVTHAFVAAPPDAVPPAFVGQGVGVVPNAAVWGTCRGGAAADAVGACPLQGTDQPAAWDGRAYWSTGAMLPRESREIPLAADIEPGVHRLICALHPDLRVDVEVTADGAVDDVVGPPEVPTDDPDGEPGPAADPATGERAVLVGPRTGDVQHNRFVPDVLEVDPGDEVVWTTATRTPHDVVLGVDEPPDLAHTDPGDALPSAPDGMWDGATPIRSGYLGADPAAPGGDRFAVTFGEPGTYPYFCRFHPGMTGTVVVRSR